LHGSKEPL